MGQQDLTDLNPPRKVLALGRPEQVFRASSRSVTSARVWFYLFGLPSALIGLLLVSIPVAALTLTKEADRAKIEPLMLLVPPLFSLFFWVAAGFLFVQAANAGDLPVYAIYPTALAIYRDGEWSVIAWEEVSEVLPHGLFRWYPALTFPDGRTEVLRYRIDNPWFLSMAVAKAFRASRGVEPEAPLFRLPLGLEEPAPETDMPPAAGSTSAVPRYRGPSGSIPPDLLALGSAEHLHRIVPPEILALGPAERLHKPAPLLLFARENPVTLIGTGLLLIAAGALELGLGGVDSLALVFGMFGLMVVGVLIAMLPAIAKGIPTFLVYPDALVEVKGNEFAVLRWDEIKELNAGRVLVTSDGQQFHLNGMVEDLGRLYKAVQSRLQARLMPQVTAALNARQPVTFGPFTVSPTWIGYRGKKLAWGEVTSMRIVVTGGQRTLHIRDGHILPWCSVNLARVPNDWLFQDAVKRVCPPHLLVWTRR